MVDEEAECWSLEPSCVSHHSSERWIADRSADILDAEPQTNIDEQKNLNRRDDKEGSSKGCGGSLGGGGVHWDGVNGVRRLSSCSSGSEGDYEYQTTR